MKKQTRKNGPRVTSDSRGFLRNKRYAATIEMAIIVKQSNTHQGPLAESPFRQEVGLYGVSFSLCRVSVFAYS